MIPKKSKNHSTEKKTVSTEKSKVTDIAVKLFLAASLIFVVFYFSRYGTSTSSDLEKGTLVSSDSQSPLVSPEPSLIVNQFPWKTYESREFGFSLQYPPSLSVNDMGNVGGYLDFIRFEEEPSLNLTDKGIAVGVSVLSLEKEVPKIKEQIEKEGGAVLAGESPVEFKGFVATRLYYKPEDTSAMEERVILVFRGNSEYTYSLSTVPDQINRVAEEFNLIQK